MGTCTTLTGEVSLMVLGAFCSPFGAARAPVVLVAGGGISVEAGSAPVDVGAIALSLSVVTGVGNMPVPSAERSRPLVRPKSPRIGEDRVALVGGKSLVGGVGVVVLSWKRPVGGNGVLPVVDKMPVGGGRVVLVVGKIPTGLPALRSFPTEGLAPVCQTGSKSPRARGVKSRVAVPASRLLNSTPAAVKATRKALAMSCARPY